MASGAEDKAPGQAPKDKAAEGGAGALTRLSELGWQALPAIGSAIGFAGFVAVIGAAIEWIRFEAAHLPATQAVLAVPKQELVIVGALALSAFVIGAVLAVLLVYIIDSNGKATPGTARGLVAVAVIEMLVTLFFIEVHHHFAYFLLFVWLVATGVVAAYVVAGIMRNFQSRGELKHVRATVVSAQAKLEAAKLGETAAKEADEASPTEASGKAREQAQLALLSAEREWEAAIREWVAAADAIIAEAIQANTALRSSNSKPKTGTVLEKMQKARAGIAGYLDSPSATPTGVELSASLDEAERTLGHVFRAVADHLLAQLSAVAEKLERNGLLAFAAILCVAAALLIFGGILFAAKEHSFRWVAMLLGVAAVLATMNLFVARATEKFAWYGVSVFFSVLLFGAALTIARTLDKPSVQPIALVRKGEDVGVCGVYITQTNERVYVGRLELRHRRPGLIFWIPTSEVELVDVGQLERIDPKFPRLAASMLRQLYKDRAEEAPQALKNTTVTGVTVGAKAGDTTTTTSETPPARLPATTYPTEPAVTSCTSP